MEWLFESGIINCWQKKYEIRKELKELNIVDVPSTIEYEMRTFLLYIAGILLSLIGVCIEQI